MDYALIAEKIDANLRAFEAAAETYRDSTNTSILNLALLPEQSVPQQETIREIRNGFATGIAALNEIVTLFPGIVASIDDLKPHYTPDPVAEYAEILEEATGWRRFVPGLRYKKEQVLVSGIAQRNRSISIQQAWQSAKDWNEKTIRLLLEVDDTFGPYLAQLEDYLVDIKEAAIFSRKRTLDEPADLEAHRIHISRRLCMEEIATIIRDAMATLVLHKRELSLITEKLRRHLNEINREEDFFNIKSPEDAELYLENLRAGKAENAA